MEIKNIFRSILVTLLLSPPSTSIAANYASPKVAPSQKQVVLDTIRPSLEAAAKFAAQSKAARDVDELQTQIQTLLNETKALYRAANAKLDKLAIVGILKSPEGIPNFEEVIPGIYRLTWPAKTGPGFMLIWTPKERVIHGTKASHSGRNHPTFTYC